MKVWPWLLGGLGALFLTAVAVPPSVALNNIADWLLLFRLESAAEALRSAIPPQSGASIGQWGRVLIADGTKPDGGLIFGAVGALSLSGVGVFFDARESRESVLRWARWIFIGVIVVLTALLIIGALTSP